jgi:hypothetical protein
MAVHVRSEGVRFDKLKLVDAKVMREIGKLAVDEILRQTDAGRDYQGRAFKPYSEGYADRKATYRGGRLGADIGTGGVDLKVTGRMLNDLQIISTTPRKVVLGFVTARSAELAFYHVESGAGKSHVIRDFFGLTQRFLDEAVRRVKASWK